MLDLRCCDCKDLMKEFSDKHFDLAIVDPPYKDDVKGLKMGYNRSHFNFNYFKAPDQEYINELFRVSKNQIIWGFNYFLELLPNTDNVIVWDKHQNGHFSECELAWSSLGPTKIFDRPYQRDIGNKIHPTQKPVELYDFCLKNFAKPGYKILDTHLGSGNIGISCHYYGCDLTASEIDERCFEKALKNIKENTIQLKAF